MRVRVFEMVIALLVLSSCVVSANASSDERPFGAGFHTQQMPVRDGTQYLRVGGSGPAVVLLHGFGDTGDMWKPLAVDLSKNHTVIVPDLRGLGLSSHPEGGYEKVSQARDLIGILDRLDIHEFALVTHDIGNMVGYALAAQIPDRVGRWVVMDAPLPGLGSWDKQLTNPKVWHFNFRGPDVERLVAGRERILLDRFYNELSANPSSIDERTRDHYARLYSLPGAIHDAFSGQFAAFPEDAKDNQALFAKVGKLKMPILAIGGDHSYGAFMAEELSQVADNVRSSVIQNSGHWIMEEQPRQAMKVIEGFIDPARDAQGQKRLAPADITQLRSLPGGTGTSGVSGVTTTVLFGDPSEPGLYSVHLAIAPGTIIQPHWHRDTRTATVVSGEWHFGYGPVNVAAVVKKLAPGSFL